MPAERGLEGGLSRVITPSREKSVGYMYCMNGSMGPQSDMAAMLSKDPSLPPCVCLCVCGMDVWDGTDVGARGQASHLDVVYLWVCTVLILFFC